MLGKYIYVACEDGSIRILKVKKKSIQLVKMLVKSTASCLSIDVVAAESKISKPKKTIIKKQNKNSDSESSDDEEEEEDQLTGPAQHIFAGYSDGTIKKWEVKTGNSILHIQKGTKKSKCLIWCLKRFKDEYLISGDSLGEVSIWDLEFGTLIKTFNHLKADILTLEVNLKHDTIYASGVDSRVISISL